MKKLILFITALCMVTLLNAQTNAVDEFFDKYSEKEGFTTVTISSKLLSLFAGKKVKGEGSDVINRLTSIRILSVEDSVLNQSVNFYKELTKKLDISAYEELMVVKEGPDVTKFLVKQKGDIVSELLMITGGPANNTLISIKGDLDLKSLSELSNETGIDELKSLEKIDKKNQEK
jgi:Domain of unknown function (DUF4252)